MLNPSSHSSKERLNLQIVRALICNHPIPVLTSMWVSLVFVGYLAALGLLSPGSIPRDRLAETTQAAKIVEDSPTELPDSAPVQDSQTPQPTSADDRDSQASQPGFTKVHASSPEVGVPVWLFGALALTCAAGSLLIYGSLKKTKPRRKPVKQGATNLKVSPTEAIPNKRQPSSRRPRPKEPLSVSQPPRSVANIPVVTVLPPEESHPLDWGEKSLADMMDLRKQQSLASLLRDRH